MKRLFHSVHPSSPARASVRDLQSVTDGQRGMKSSGMLTRRTLRGTGARADIVSEETVPQAATAAQEPRWV